MNKQKITLKGTIEISQGLNKERVPIKIISSNEDDNFIQSVQFFQPATPSMEPRKFKNRLRYIAKTISENLTNINGGNDENI
jgi:coenzyme F420-reducing hydrogenase delta subunit